MKKILLLSLIFAQIFAFAQTTPKYKNVKLSALPIGTKSDSVVLWNGATKLLMHKPLSEIIEANSGGGSQDLQSVLDTGNEVLTEDVDGVVLDSLANKTIRFKNTFSYDSGLDTFINTIGSDINMLYTSTFNAEANRLKLSLQGGLVTAYYTELDNYTLPYNYGSYTQTGFEVSNRGELEGSTASLGGGSFTVRQGSNTSGDYSSIDLVSLNSNPYVTLRKELNTVGYKNVTLSYNPVSDYPEIELVTQLSGIQNSFVTELTANPTLYQAVMKTPIYNGTYTGIVSVNGVQADANGNVTTSNTIYTVSTLPTGVLNDMAIVSDATAPTYLGTLIGGGSVVCPVWHNGTTWVSH